MQMDGQGQGRGLKLQRRRGLSLSLDISGTMQTDSIAQTPSLLSYVCASPSHCLRQIDAVGKKWSFQATGENSSGNISARGEDEENIERTLGKLDKDIRAMLPAVALENRPGSKAAGGSSVLNLMKRRGCNLSVQVTEGRTGFATEQQKGMEPLCSLDDTLAQEFDLTSRLGSGSTSIVHGAISKVDGSKVAVKISRADDADNIRFARKEYDILTNLSYPTLPRMYGFRACMMSGRVALVMELFHGSELASAVKSAPKRCFEEDVVLRLARQLLGTLEYLHKHGILHRDVNPGNILVSDGLESMRLIDFNASHSMRNGESLTPVAGTRTFAAPEVLQGDPSRGPCDVWGAGLSIFYALSGRLPQGRQVCSDAQSLQEQATKEVSFAARCWEPVSDECKSCLQKCLAVQADDRLTPKQLVQAEPWLR